MSLLSILREHEADGIWKIANHYRSSGSETFFVNIERVLIIRIHKENGALYTVSYYTPEGSERSDLLVNQEANKVDYPGVQKSLARFLIRKRCAQCNGRLFKNKNKLICISCNKEN